MNKTDKFPADMDLMSVLQSRTAEFRDGPSLGHPFVSEASLHSAVLTDSLDHNSKEIWWEICYSLEPT